MQRLLKISFDQALLSLTPILSWFLLSILVDKNLINVFTITYPLSCLYNIILCPFSVGANICKTKDKDKNAIMSGFVVGLTLTLLAYGAVLFRLDDYITFLHMDPNIYRTFTFYSIIILIVQTIFTFILNKLYYEDRNSTANRYSITFNLLNFFTVIGMAIISKNQFVIVGVTSIVMILYAAFIIATNCEKFHFHLNLARCFKYDSSSFISYATSFFIYLFGLSNALDFGAAYGLAITFVQLITDTQWDILESIKTLAKIDISQHRFNYKKSLRNSYKLLGILLTSSAIMFFCLYRFYELDLTITLIFFGLEITDFLLTPAEYLNTPYLQLHWSSSKTAANKFVARVFRLLSSFLPTPFCNIIGQLSSTIYQRFTTNYYLHKYFLLDKNGRLSKRRTPHKLTTGYAYDDITIDK